MSPELAQIRTTYSSEKPHAIATPLRRDFEP